MSRLVIVVENPADWGAYYPSTHVVAARDYLRQIPANGERTQVINLCRSYRYLGSGYYVSLLAEARGHRVMPSVRTINGLRRRALYSLDIGDLNLKLAQVLRDNERERTDFDILVCFGQTAHPLLQDLARQVFELFPCPLLRIAFRRDRQWQIASIRPVGLHALDDTEEDVFAAALEHFASKVWRKPRARRRFRYDIAMLVNPEESLPPSNRGALKAFVAAGKQLDVEVDPIGPHDYARLAEYDGLFIRETTAIDHHTYRFAHRAEQEGMVVIDDPASILRCTNKIFLHDLLAARRLAVPDTEILFREDTDGLDSLPDRLGLPIVLKIPDGSFSRGVVKVETVQALRKAVAELFGQSVLIIAQRYLYTDFDWRIGVLNREPLYACQYFMSRGHWQIYDHTASGPRSGGFRTLPVRQAPAEVVRLAVKAANAIGDGLYGVDLKQAGGRTVVIEVNDNPSIDAGVEDAYLGQDLYRRIIGELVRRLERKRLGVTG